MKHKTQELSRAGLLQGRATFLNLETKRHNHQMNLEWALD